MPTKVKELALDMLNMVDVIVKQNISNSLILMSYNKFILPFLRNRISITDDEIIKKNLQASYEKLKPFFEKKQIKEMIDEAEKLGSIKLPKVFLNEEREYF
tara:strand:+ start:23 stop:325 length:303 start_codon:yes stop_codon:yes gene_type:complete